jgi:hypothetical protein
MLDELNAEIVGMDADFSHRPRICPAGRCARKTSFRHREPLRPRGMPMPSLRRRLLSRWGTVSRGCLYPAAARFSTARLIPRHPASLLRAVPLNDGTGGYIFHVVVARGDSPGASPGFRSPR